MDNERMRRRLEWRRSSATQKHRNRYRERKTGQQPWEREDFRDQCVAEDWEDPDDAA
jgi:hypothetical protein